MKTPGQGTRLRPGRVLITLVLVLHYRTSASVYHLRSKEPSAADVLVESGCADGSTEGLQDRRHPRLAACDGRWRGHVANASTLCAAGWSVCGPESVELLRTIDWTDASSLAGCYALNAAQDDGTCRPCVAGDKRQDDLAGVGSGCPHRSYGTDSCISGGQMDISCCTDSVERACSYRPGLVTGVICCRRPGVPPKIVVRPAPVTHVQAGGLFVLSCQAVGSPEPRVDWLRDGRPLATDGSAPRRVAAFDSGYLVVSLAELSDSATYRCVAANSAGNATAQARVVVTDHPSGCADGTTEGLFEYEEVQACRGRWHGHVKRAKTLCAPGWQVCSPRHATSLKLLTWSDVTELDGCYAYNAANSLNMCSVCRRGEMAGVGRDCGKHRPGQKSCLADGLIEVTPTRTTSEKSRLHRGAQCEHIEGHTTGVLCCRRPEKWQTGARSWSAPRCRPECENGGVCVADGKCQCAHGYKGAYCQNPICPGGCIPNSVCVRPALCRCLDGFTGPKCKSREPVAGRPSATPSANHETRATPTRTPPPAQGEVVKTSAASAIDAGQSTVSSPSSRPAVGCRCLNGGRCVNDACKCPPTHRGSRCGHAVGHQRHLPNGREIVEPPDEINRTEQQ